MNDNPVYSQVSGDIRHLQEHMKWTEEKYERLFEMIEDIRADVKQVVKLEERQISMSSAIHRMDKHLAKQGEEIKKIELRLALLEDKVVPNTKLRNMVLWGSVAIIGTLISGILAYEHLRIAFSAK